MVKLVAEIGINHNGNLDKAKKIIDAFDFVDVIKMQKMSPVHFLGNNYDAPHLDPDNAFGSTYGAHREHLELSIEKFEKIKKHVIERGMEFASSVCDIESARQIIDLNPLYVKIPSCRNNNRRLLDFVLENWKHEIHISDGMTDLTERNFINNYANNRFTVYSCTADYTATGPVYMERRAGLSCHSPDILFGQAAILNGAKWVEYHVTTDQEQKGTDHRISLLPAAYKELRKWLEDNAEALERIKFKKPNTVPDCEIPARSKFWSTA